MFSRDNYIYTEKGLYTPEKLDEMQSNNITLPKVMTFSYDEKTKDMLYTFVQPYQIVKTPDVIEMYSARFLDMFSSKNITIYCSLDTEILKYTILSVRNIPTANIFTEVVQYIEKNRDLQKMIVQWESIGKQTNYANRSPNICLGDTTVKYQEREYKSLDNGYKIIDENNNSIPIFISLTHSTFYNNILVK